MDATFRVSHWWGSDMALSARSGAGASRLRFSSRNKGQALLTGAGRSRCFLVVVLSQESSDGKAGTPEMLDVEIQVSDSLLRVSMDGLDLNSMEIHPFGLCSTVGVVCPEHEATGPQSTWPLSGHVDAREVRVRTEAAHLLRNCLNVEQGVFKALPPRDMNQHMLARLHQIKPLSMKVLQVGIAYRTTTAQGRARHRRGAGGSKCNQIGGTVAPPRQALEIS